MNSSEEYSDYALSLFESFNKSDLIYCHWKSTKHLDCSLRGLTDLDVLVDSNQFRLCEMLVLNCGFIRARTPELRTYPCVEDYILFDEELMVWIHLHLHYQLPCGDRWVKSYRFPIEKYVLKNRVFVKDQNTYVVDPISEYLMFVARMCVKWRFPQNHSSVKSEHAYLLINIMNAGLSYDEIRNHPLCLDGFFEEVKFWIERDLEKVPLLSSYRIRQIVKYYRRMNYFEFIVKHFIRYSYRIYIEFARRIMGDMSRGRRSLISGQFIVVFVGMDGSGKTTMLAEAYKCFSRQLNVKKIFLGTGKSGAGVIRKLIFLLVGFLDVLFVKRKRKITTEKAKEISVNKNEVGFCRTVWHFLCLVDRKIELNKLIKSASNGTLCLVDRWPQNYVESIADAPRLVEHIGSSGFIGYVARKEYEFYKRIAQIEPSVFIWLDIEPEVSVKRKPGELDLKFASEYRDALSALNTNYFKSCEIVDANRGYAEVKKQVYRKIWGKLRGQGY